MIVCAIKGAMYFNVVNQIYYYIISSLVTKLFYRSQSDDFRLQKCMIRLDLKITSIVSR